MNIPDKAIEDGTTAIYDRMHHFGLNGTEAEWAATAVLQASSPAVVAQALRDEADYLDAGLDAVLDGDPEDLSTSRIIQRLRARANELGQM